MLSVFKVDWFGNRLWWYFVIHLAGLWRLIIGRRRVWVSVKESPIVYSSHLQKSDVMNPTCQDRDLRFERFQQEAQRSCYYSVRET